MTTEDAKDSEEAFFILFAAVACLEAMPADVSGMAPIN
jgi:hypothetical protein